MTYTRENSQYRAVMPWGERLQARNRDDLKMKIMQAERREQQRQYLKRRTDRRAGM